MTDDEKTRISDAIELLFENCSIEDVAEIMTIQMAGVIAQGSTSLEDAQDFLDDVRQDILDYLQHVDFSDPAESDGDADAPPPTQRN